MKISSSEQDAFLDIFNVPAFVRPWADRFFEPSDITAGLSLVGKLPEPSPDPVATGRFRRLPDEELSPAALKRALRRGILRDGENGGLEIADFHDRFEVWAFFEGWKDIPADIQTRLNQWELDHYTARVRPQIDTLKVGRPLDFALVWPTYLLLDEAEAVLDRVDQIFLWPCNCRAMMQACRQTMFTCLRFENDRGLGWEISKERARSIVHEANRNGLMQSGELGLTPDGSLHGAICNCCVDCCYPLQAAARLGAEKRWPFTRFIARYRGSECNGCSRCARRCPFGAFEAVTDTTAGDDRPRRRGVRYHAVKCRGCGLCATGCPEAAIVMEPVDDPLAASFPLNSHRTP